MHQNQWQELHRRTLVADMHCDTAMRLVQGFDLGASGGSGAIDLARLEKGNVKLQVFACWISPDTPLQDCPRLADEMIDAVLVQLQRYTDRIALARSATEAKQIIASQRVAAVLAIENGSAIANSLDNLDHYYHRGVRILTLTHAKSNEWCTSSSDESPDFDGLTDFGRQVIRRMNQLGMIIDISHASQAAVRRVLEVSDSPVLASHSCVYNLCPHHRNLTDEQIKAIAYKEGVIGINFYPGYLSPRWAMSAEDPLSIYEQGPGFSTAPSLSDLGAGKPTTQRPANAKYLPQVRVEIDELVDHIEYVVNLVGSDYVGLGSDFDGVPAVPLGLEDASCMPNITAALLRRGFSEDAVTKIMGGNFMRIFKQVCG